MRIFIAGATGVYGRNVVPHLLQRGHRVRAMVRSAEKAAGLQRQGVETVTGDLLEAGTRARLAELISGCDAVLHLATAIPANAGAPGAWDANTALRTTGTRALLDAALAAGAHRYVQQSIVMAYIDGGDRLLDEATPLAHLEERPTAPPVLAMEVMVRAVPPERLAWCILRGGSFVGPDTAQMALVQRVREGREVTPGDGSHFISPVHVADMAAATVVALEQAPAGAIYNVNDEPLRYREYVEALAQVLGAPYPPCDPSRPTPASCRADNRAVRAALGWSPSHTLFEHLASSREP